MIKIEKGIEIPDAKFSHSRRRKYPFLTMEIGDSFLVECEEKDIQRIGSIIKSSSLRYKPFEFTTRKVDKGIRCWRIK